MRLCFALVAIALSTAQAQGVETVKGYLLERLAVQKRATSELVAAAGRYFEVAEKAGFDYRKLSRAPAAGPVRASLVQARAAWTKASPAYESVEGIVAGVESLAGFDLDLDAGASQAEGGDAVVSFDLRLANGRLLPRPGNAFGVVEGSLWGTEKAFSSGVAFDVDGDGKLGFGDRLPEAFVLKAAAEKLDELTAGLIAAAKDWKPTAQDVFGALAANVPTTAPVFLERWKTSRFVLGDKATRRDFNVISSLRDLMDNITSWQRLYQGVSPQVQAKDAALDAQILEGLRNLKAWTQRLWEREKTRRFTPEQAETLIQEGHDRATAITGKIVQAAALLGIRVEP